MTSEQLKYSYTFKVAARDTSRMDDDLATKGEIQAYINEVLGVRKPAKADKDPLTV